MLQHVNLHEPKLKSVNREQIAATKRREFAGEAIVRQVAGFILCFDKLEDTDSQIRQVAFGKSAKSAIT